MSNGREKRKKKKKKAQMYVCYNALEKGTRKKTAEGKRRVK